MALKTSNKNRKKILLQKNETVEKENSELIKKFTKYYIIIFLILTFIFFVI